MGGYGSGRWPWGYKRKRTVSECDTLSVATLAEAISHGPGYRGAVYWTVNGQKVGSIGYAIEAEGDGLAVRLIYSISKGGAKIADLSYTVPVAWAKAGFGSPRPFFLCPGLDCGQRVAKLYLPPNERLFLCRTCHNLTYQSCLDGHKWDVLRKALDLIPPDLDLDPDPSDLDRLSLLKRLAKRWEGG